MNQELKNPAKAGEPATPPPGSRYRNAVAVAWIAAVFCLLVCGSILFQHATATTNDPWKAPQLLVLKTELQAAPKNEQIKTEIRQLDLNYRQRYFRRLALDQMGGWLLIGGIVVFLLAAKQAAECNKRPPVPLTSDDAAKDAMHQAARARCAVAIVGVVACGALAALKFGIHSQLPSNPAELKKLLGGGASDVGVDLPPFAEFQANWPRFRGPDGSGFSAQPLTAPVSWDAKKGEGIAWKSAIPAPGFNSPIVWKDRVFLSGGTADQREVLCYDADNGKLLWRRPIENVPGSGPSPQVNEQTGYAASTMATDGRRAYVVFANGDLAAVTFDGAVAWAKSLGVPKNQYGHATSLAIWEGRLIVQLDQGESGPGNSKLVAFDGASGRVLWEKARPVGSSWASPIVVQASGKPQIITLGVPFVIAYSVANGSELWRAELLEGDLAPSPILAGGLVCAVNPSSKIFAIRPDGSGDVTKTNVAWTGEENIPDVTSPASNGELVFFVTSNGLLTCLDAKDGKKQWDHDFGTEVQASPAIAGNRVYVIATNGSAFVAEAGRQFKQLAQCATEDKIYASPAFANGRIYLRGMTNLICIGPNGPAPAPAKEGK